MRKLKPNLYVEAYGIVYRKYEKEDCRKIRDNILSHRQGKELITEIFQPVIEMMDACEDISLNQENPLYASCSFWEEMEKGKNLFSELFFTYYRSEEQKKPSEVIGQAFVQDKGQEFVENVFDCEEKLTEEPVLAVMHSEWKEQDKFLLLKILLDGEQWIREFCLLLEQIAQRIAPIVEKYQGQYRYLDELLEEEDAQKKVFERVRLKPMENAAVMPVMSICNMGIMRAREIGGEVFLMIHMGTLHCVMDFFEPEEFSREQILEHLKCLSDSTKLSILTILREKPTYQTDLAKRLGLTTATISHHMNQLIQNGFVTHRLEEKKVYYEYQPEMVRYTCEQVGKLLS